MPEGQYVILAQRPTSEIGADGRVVDAMEITFRDEATGVEDRITVDKARYNVGVVNALISERVAAIRDVHKLTG